MRDRLSFADSLRLFNAVVIATTCCILLAGCASRTKVADQPSAIAGSSMESSVARESKAESSDPPAPLGPTKSSQGSNQGQTITFKKTVHDFGEVSPRSKNVCEFSFKNTGAGVLTVGRKIGSTCGCTAIALAKTDYAPGEEGVIKVTYSAGSRTATEKRYIIVHSNDKNNPQVRLTIMAKIVPRVVCEPQQLDLSLKDKTCPPITLRSMDGTAFSVRAIMCTGNSITADFDPSVRATEFKIHPTLNVENLQKLPDGYLALSLTHPECKQVTIRYNTRSGFQFVPALPMFFNTEPNIPAQKTVRLSNNNGEDFEIASFSSEKNLVDVLEKTKLDPDGRGEVSYRLIVSITPPIRTAEERFFTDILSVHLTNGQALRLTCRGIYAMTQAKTSFTPP